MKIKKTAEMTLPQLIEWAWENDGEARYFVNDRGDYVFVNSFGEIDFDIDFVSKSDTFKFDIEEEITENTELDLLEVTNDKECYLHKGRSLKEILVEGRELSEGSQTKFIYLQNDDGSIGQLIWKDGEMVE